MTLPVHPNPISLEAIRTEFLISGGVSLEQLYSKLAGPVYSGQGGFPGGVNTPIPASGPISLASFHGATAYIPSARTVNITTGSGTWTVPSTVVGNLTIRAFGGGGGGSIWPSGSAGGAGGGGAKFVGSIPGGTAISYSIATAGRANFGDSSRTARDPGNTQFGSSGQAWYMYIPGLYVGAYNMSGSQRGPGQGSTAQGSAGITLGRGGNGAAERGGTAQSATTIGAGGAGYAGSAGFGYGADGGGNGNTGQSANRAGYWPGGGGGGWNGNYPGFGAEGGIIITGTW